MRQNKEKWHTNRDESVELLRNEAREAAMRMENVDKRIDFRQSVDKLMGEIDRMSSKDKREELIECDKIFNNNRSKKNCTNKRGSVK